MTTTVGGITVNLTLESIAFIRNLDKSAAATARATKQMEQSLNRLQTTVSNTGKAVASFFGARFALDAARQLAQYSDAWQEAKNQIAAASEISGIAARSMEQINDIAVSTRSGIEETAELYAKLLRSTEDVAKSENEVAQATQTVSQAFKAGGASTLEQVNAIRQLAQALGSGILQGDELRSIRENAPLLAKAIAEEFQTTVAGLKQLGAEGQLTSDRVFKAILNAQGEIATAFGKTNSTISQSFVVLRDRLVEFVANFNDATKASNALTSAVLGIADAIDRFGGSIKRGESSLSDIVPLIRETTEFVKDLKRVLGFDDAFEGLSKQADLTSGLAREFDAFFKIMIPGLAIFKGLRATLRDIREAFGLLEDAVGGVSTHVKSLAVEIPKVKDFRPTYINEWKELFGVLSQVSRAIQLHNEVINQVGTPLEQYNLQLQEIAAGGYSAADAARLQADALYQYKDALDAQLETVGLGLTPLQEYEATLRRIEAAHLSGATAASAQAAAEAQLYRSQLAVRESVGLSITPLEEMRAKLLEIEAAETKTALTAIEASQARFGAYAGVAAGVLDLAGQVTGAFAGLFKDNKALAIANAVISTAEAIVKTIAQYGATPWGLAAAGVAAAVGAAQIATIASTEPGSSKTIKKPAGGSSASTPARAGEASRGGGGRGGSSATSVNITLEGEGGFSKTQVRALIGQINEAVGDGATLRVN